MTAKELIEQSEKYQENAIKYQREVNPQREDSLYSDKSINQQCLETMLMYVTSLVAFSGNEDVEEIVKLTNSAVIISEQLAILEGSMEYVEEEQ